jgi:hypothetical protein
MLRSYIGMKCLNEGIPFERGKKSLKTLKKKAIFTVPSLKLYYSSKDQ